MILETQTNASKRTGPDAADCVDSLKRSGNALEHLQRVEAEDASTVNFLQECVQVVLGAE